ncbi:unnamed protein product, partial [Rotaria sp. Silwood1]
MFENKYAKLPDEPPMPTNIEIDPSSSSVNTVRNNGPIPSSSSSSSSRKH